MIRTKRHRICTGLILSTQMHMHDGQNGQSGTGGIGRWIYLLVAGTGRDLLEVRGDEVGDWGGGGGEGGDGGFHDGCERGRGEDGEGPGLKFY